MKRARVSGEVRPTTEEARATGSLTIYLLASQQVKLIIKQQHLADQPLRNAAFVCVLRACVRVCSAKRAVILVPGLCQKGQGKHLTGKR